LSLYAVLKMTQTTPASFSEGILRFVYFTVLNSQKPNKNLCCNQYSCLFWVDKESNIKYR
jgi:hypothetical protein